LNICFAYTATDEIARAARLIAEGVQSRRIEMADIDESLFEYCLDSFDQLHPEIIIRTSGVFSCRFSFRFLR
jgi:undecaprenyl diphosphate synthase